MMTTMTEYENELQRLLTECLQELGMLGIYPSGKIVAIRENSRAKKRLGCCKKRDSKGQEYELEVSTLLKGQDEKTIKEIIIHEILHTCKGCFNHGSRWHRLAEQVYRAYGYRIESTADYKRLNLEEELNKQYRYCIRCQGCGNTFFRMRAGKIVKYPDLYRCGLCNGRLRVSAVADRK